MARPRKTVEEKRRNGTYRPSRHGGEASPQPVAAVECPSWVHRLGRDEFVRLADVMTRGQTLSAGDIVALSLYADVFGFYLELRNRVKNANDLVVSTPSGSVKVSPLATLLRSHRDDCLRAGAKLGLSPMDRRSVNKLTPDEDAEKDDFDREFGRR